jgi:hypothetical protein
MSLENERIDYSSSDHAGLRLKLQIADFRLQIGKPVCSGISNLQSEICNLLIFSPAGES